MIFSELYSAYYRAVADILKAAAEKPLSKKEIRALIEAKAFGESALSIEPALSEERWQLLRADGSSVLRHPPSMPLTTLEKRWLKAVYVDPRIRLFTDESPDFPELEPLFTAEDYAVFDRYTDGDPYEDEGYIRNFRAILAAIQSGQALRIDTRNRHGALTHLSLLPEYLEYSEKDDKFRLYGHGHRHMETVNLGRIVSVSPYEKPFTMDPRRTAQQRTRTVEFELSDERNALERVLMHFAHFEKEAEKIDDRRYRVRVRYDKDDETELVIRVLSFGPMIRVTAPEHFVELIKERLIKQKSCEP